MDPEMDLSPTDNGGASQKKKKVYVLKLFILYCLYGTTYVVNFGMYVRARNGSILSIEHFYGRLSFGEYLSIKKSTNLK